MHVGLRRERHLTPQTRAAFCAASRRRSGAGTPRAAETGANGGDVISTARSIRDVLSGLDVAAIRNQRWHKYDLIAPSADVLALLDELDRDPTCICWG